ncbi:MAG: hypothetical protein V1793_15820 [Pseudomonadota bacterium]
MITLALGFSPAWAQDRNAPVLLPNPDWVHPSMRQKYPGYAKQVQDRSSGTGWTFSTNRPGGNIRGGGTTPFADYRPLFPATPLPGKRK